MIPTKNNDIVEVIIEDINTNNEINPIDIVIGILWIIVLIFCVYRI